MRTIKTHVSMFLSAHGDVTVDSDGMVPVVRDGDVTDAVSSIHIGGEDEQEGTRAAIVTLHTVLSMALQRIERRMREEGLLPIDSDTLAVPLKKELMS